MKRIIPALLCLVIAASGISVGGANIYDTKTETILTDGVVQTRHYRFTDNGWYKIYTVRIDLNNSFLGLKTLTSNKGVHTRENVLELAKQHNALAAVNADFFQPSGSDATKASAIGVVVDNGRMLTSPARGKSMATAAMDFENTVTMGLWDQYMNVEAPNGATRQIIHVNKYFDEGGLVLYNSEWEANTPGAPGVCTEMIVTDDTVAEFRQGEAGKPYPENSYVIASTDYDTFLTDNFSVGDAVKVDTWFSPNPEAYKMAVGGGTLLLSEGKDAPVTHNISGTHPRTAMGVDKSGKIVYLVAVEGRQTYSAGMTLSEMRNYMRELGCYYAINFDGGGSTTLVSKTPLENILSLKNKVSDGAMRRVTSAVGVMLNVPLEELASGKPAVGKPAVLDMAGSDTVYYADAEYTFTPRVYDRYYRSLDFDAGEVNYSVSGIDGYFSGNTLHTNSSGNAQITAKYKNLTAAVNIYVKPKKEEGDSDAMRLPPDAETKGTRIAVLGNTNYTTILGKLYAYRMVNKAAALSDTMAFLGSVRQDVSEQTGRPKIYGEYYYAAYKQDNVIIQLNNKSGGLRKSDAEQWIRFLEQMDNTGVKNVVITMSQPPNAAGFPDADELALFKRLLEEKLVDKGKNVFVAYADNKNSVFIENGIRYIGIKGISDVKATDFTSLKACTYLLISSDGDTVNYQLKPIL